MFLDSKDFLSEENEKNRYNEHNNDITDPGYRGFVKPVTDRITDDFNVSHRGLDFGCGTGPVITAVLQERNYDIKSYDPFFCNDPKLLQDRYDYIACCEVVEHFHDPYKEFGLLRTMLNKNGRLCIMTDFFGERAENDFLNWYYKNDPTHVFFYHEKTFQWIVDVFGFSSMERDGRLIVLTG